MRTLPTNNALIKAYVFGFYYEARNPRDSLSFVGNSLNSYSSPLARINRADHVLFINYGLMHYSVTTTAHISALTMYCGDPYQIFAIPFDRGPLQVLTWYWKQIEVLIGKYLRARVYKDNHKSSIHRLLVTIEQYVDYEQLDRSCDEYQYKIEITRQLFKHQLLKD